MLRRIFTSSYMAGVALAALAHGGLLAGVFLLAPASASSFGAQEDTFTVTLVEDVAPDPVPEPDVAPMPEPETPSPSPVPETVETPPEPAVQTVAEPAPPEGMVPSDDVPPAELSSVDAGRDDATPAAEKPAALTLDPGLPVTTSETRSAKTQNPASTAAPGGEGQGKLDAYVHAVRSQLARHAPRGVRGAGDCQVEFRLSRAGEVVFVGLRTSSGSRLYDRRCLSSVTSAVPFPAAPDGAVKADLSFTIVMQQKR